MLIAPPNNTPVQLIAGTGYSPFVLVAPACLNGDRLSIHDCWSVYATDLTSDAPTPEAQHEEVVMALVNCPVTRDEIPFPKREHLATPADQVFIADEQLAAAWAQSIHEEPPSLF